MSNEQIPAETQPRWQAAMLGWRVVPSNECSDPAEHWLALGNGAER